MANLSHAGSVFTPEILVGWGDARTDAVTVANIFLEAERLPQLARELPGGLAGWLALYSHRNYFGGGTESAVNGNQTS